MWHYCQTYLLQTNLTIESNFLRTQGRLVWLSHYRISFHSFNKILFTFYTFNWSTNILWVLNNDIIGTVVYAKLSLNARESKSDSFVSLYTKKIMKRQKNVALLENLDQIRHFIIHDRLFCFKFTYEPNRVFVKLWGPFS